MPFLIYAIALLIAAGTLAFSVNLATAPDPGAIKPRIAANTAVRQIPLGKAPDVSRGDPHNQLTPVYPAAPGKDLQAPAAVASENAPSSDAGNDALKNAAATAPEAASTTGNAPSRVDTDPPRVDVSAIDGSAVAPNSCAVAACSSAYRSFRASDCTYQPYDGPRRICALDAGGVQNASAVSVSSPSRRDGASRGQVSNRVSDLDAAARVVRQLPRPDDYESPGERRMIVIDRPAARYAPRVIYEEW